MKNDTEARQAIAKTIIAQMGGREFLAMTGAKNLMAMESGLSFRLPPGARDGINHVEITLTPADLYDVTFRKIRGLNVKEVEKREGLYFDQLQDLFEARTGRYTTLKPRA